MHKSILKLSFVTVFLLLSAALMPQPAKSASCSTAYSDTFSGTFDTGTYTVFIGQTPTVSSGKLNVGTTDASPLAYILGPNYTGDYTVKVTMSNLSVSNPSTGWSHTSTLSLSDGATGSLDVQYTRQQSGNSIRMESAFGSTGIALTTPITVSGNPSSVTVTLQKVGKTFTGYYNTGSGDQLVGSLTISAMSTGLENVLRVSLHSITGNTGSFTGNTSYDNLTVGCVASSYTTKVVHRFWSDKLQTHFYTISESEKAYVLATYANTWAYEGTVFQASELSGGTCASGLSPVYRFWSDPLQRHFYTISTTERDYVMANYPNTWNNYEGAVYCASTTPQVGTIPMYRFWSDSKSAHFYTVSSSERAFVSANWGATWNHDEGLVFYAFPL
jgi:hypothetical protein